MLTLSHTSTSWWSCNWTPMSSNGWRSWHLIYSITNTSPAPRTSLQMHWATVLHVGVRLLQCSYDDLLTEALPISSDSAQEVFRQSSTTQMTVVAREGICLMCMNMPQSSPSPEVTPLPFLKHKACGSHVPGCVLLMLSKSSHSWFPWWWSPTCVLKGRVTWRAVEWSCPFKGFTLCGTWPTSIQERETCACYGHHNTLYIGRNWPHPMSPLQGIQEPSHQDKETLVCGSWLSQASDPERHPQQCCSSRAVYEPEFCPSEVSLLTKIPSQCFMYSNKFMVSCQVWLDFSLFMVDCCAKKKA